MTPPDDSLRVDDLLSPANNDISMEAFRGDFGPATTDLAEFDLPPPVPEAPRPRPPVAPNGQPNAEGVTININKGGKTNGGAVAAPKAPPHDPLSWLSTGVEGKLRVERKIGNGVNSKGVATRGKWKGKFVGLGECDVLEILGPQELGRHITEHWGGGEYFVHHLDKFDQKLRSSPPLRYPQDPKPIEGVSDNAEDEDDDDTDKIDLSFLNGPQTQNQPPYNPYGQAIDPFGRPYQVPHQQPSSPIFQPDWMQRNQEEEKSGLREEIEAERERRLAAEAAAQQAQNQRERDAERAETQRREDLLVAEMRSMRETMAKPQSSGMDVMLQMMMKQQEAAQQRYENEAKERRERDDREARERRERDERTAKEISDRERKEREERRERDERLEKERREDRRAAEIAAQAEAKRSQEFMTMVLGQKMDPLKMIEVFKSGGNNSDPMAMLNMAFDVVGRAKDLGGDDGPSESEGGVAGVLKSAIPAFRPIAEAFARAYQQRVPGNVQQVPPQVPPQQIPTQPRPPQGPPPGPPQSGGVDPTLGKIAKIVGLAGRGFAQDRDPETIAAAMLGAADMAGLMDYMGQLSAADPTMIQTQLTTALNMGLPAEQSAQLQSFLDIYGKPGGREWIKDLIDELNGGGPDEADDEPEGEGE